MRNKMYMYTLWIIPQWVLIGLQKHKTTIG